MGSNSRDFESYCEYTDDHTVRSHHTTPYLRRTDAANETLFPMFPTKVLLGLQFRNTYVRPSPLLANPILFTLNATPAPRRVIRKPLPPCRKGKDPPLCTLSISKSTVEQTSYFCTPVYTVYAANCEHAPRRRLPRVTLCPVNHGII
jgi:hypothetical protein